jgi:hypothetical protein
MYIVHMPDFSRRSIILGTAGIAAAGAGVTAAASGLSGSVEGQADVQAEQALTVESATVQGDDDASITRTSDDNREFQAAVELNNGDSVLFNANIQNSAEDNLDVQVQVDSPDPIDIDVLNDNNPGFSDGGDDLDPDDDGGTSNAIQTGEGTFIAQISGGADTENINIIAELDDTAEPGSYDIGVAINPLSTDG